MSIRRRFDDELEKLNKDLVDMGMMIESAITISMKTLESQDESGAKDIIDADKAINEKERSIESRCLKLLLRQQPVASDLRLISTAMKMITDMERIGDHAADIAMICLDDRKEDFVIIDPKIKEMEDMSLKMVKASVEAFVNENDELAKATIKEDDKVDRYFEDIRDSIVSKLKKDEVSPNIAIDTLMLIKYLERIGDHATNICEWTIFYLTGKYENQKLM